MFRISFFVEESDAEVHHVVCYGVHLYYIVPDILIILVDVLDDE